MHHSAPQHVIWDWNGTLLDDVDICLGILNEYLEARARPRLDRENYRRRFTIPIIDFYRELGIDFKQYEEYREVARIFHLDYDQRVRDCGLHPGARGVVEDLRQRRIGQSILSGLPHDQLLRHVAHFEVEHIFDSISGSTGTVTGEKLDRARNFLQAQNLSAEQTLLIGDTLHDAEVAGHLGAPCILVASGFYNAERLKAAGVPVAEDWGQLEEMLRG